MKVSLVTAFIASLAGVPAALADDIWDSLQIHGFASQALIKTSDNRYFGDSPNTSFDFTEIGLNASLRLHPKALLSGQVLVRRAGDMYDGTPSLDYALADVTALASEDGRLGVRVGRIKNPFGLYNETRDVPFTRPSIFLPQVVYYDKVRNLVLSSDGLMVYGDWFGERGDVSFSLGGGRAVLDENVAWSYLDGGFDGDMEPDSVFWIGSLWYSTAAERLKLGLSGAVFSMQFDPEHTSRIEDGTTDFFYWIASAQYNAEDWTLSAEFSREPIQWKDYGPNFPDRKVTAEGYYVQGAYRVRSDVELVLRYEEGFANRYDRDGNGVAAVTGLPAHMWFSKIWTLGARWDVNRHMMVRAEYQRHDGTFALSPRENPVPFDRRRDWDLFALQLSLRF